MAPFDSIVASMTSTNFSASNKLEEEFIESGTNAGYVLTSTGSASVWAPAPTLTVTGTFASDTPATHVASALGVFNQSYITASSTDTLTNKSISYSQLTGAPTAYGCWNLDTAGGANISVTSNSLTDITAWVQKFTPVGVTYTNNEFKVTTAGIYKIECRLALNVTDNTMIRWESLIALNGTNVANSLLRDAGNNAVSSFDFRTLIVTFTTALSTSDAIKIRIFTVTTGSFIGLVTNSIYNELLITRIA